ncbi:MAG: glycoside hydrolase family 97 catalytic domain-containing protein [Bacteroidaceae bacterium]|nr:glycoside hydrolase family 97 catalytic domain-containing protein [Bacteroidaceae bacterium]
MKTITRTASRKASFIFFTLLLGIAPAAWAQTTRVLSPDGITYADVRLEDGKLSYSAGYRTVAGRDTADVQLVQDSPLGLYTNVADFTRHLALVETGGKRVRCEYDLWQSKQSHVDKEYEQRTFTVKTPKGHLMTVDFRVGNHNVAYRYDIPMQGETAAIVVTGEATGFRFPKGTTTFLSPQSDPMIGWKRTKPSYEEEYTPDEPINTPSRYGQGYTFPCLFHEGDKGWVLVSETGLDGRYCGSHLSEGVDGLYTIAFPMEGENNGFGSTGAQFGLPGSTPWRTLTLAPTLGPIVETTVSWDVVEQLYEPNFRYTGGRSTWSWIIWQDASIVYDDQVTFINLAHDLGWEYCLIDGGWETNIGRERMEKLFSLCQEKGVHPFVWYNSNGGWNDAPQCAKQRMYSPVVRKKEMKWLHEHGVKGIKVDFFAGDKQETIKLYEQILSDANDYDLQVIFDGCTLPRGWERMYPNYVGSEAVLASENLVFNQHFDDMEGFNATLHPFCRNTVGAMEFGGTVLQRRLNRTNNGGTTRRVSDVFELGTAIAFQSAVQNFALTPMNLDERVTPKFEIDFMRRVPTTWDETRFIDGYPGRYLVIARRHANHWYVAALNAQHEPLALSVELPMLANQQVTWLDDGADGKSPAPHPATLDKCGTLKAEIPAESAVVLY